MAASATLAKYILTVQVIGDVATEEQRLILIQMHFMIKDLNEIHIGKMNAESISCLL
jgi:hypothetical protein